MIKSVEEYLDCLKTELQGSDTATIQDAVADSEEHLRAALASLRESQPQASEAETLNEVIEQYGSPEETASAYREVERLTPPGLTPRSRTSDSMLVRFFAIYADPRAWGSLLYLLIAFVTGIIYFSWAVTGLSLSISFAIFIFGLPFAILFLLSVRGLALLEGRLVEALLGVRMPRRPKFSYQNVKWWERLKLLLTDVHNWKMLLYMFLQFVLGNLYFIVVVVLLAVSISFMATPVLEFISHEAVGSLIIGNERYYPSDLQYYFPMASYPVLMICGFLLLTASMHLFKWVGGLHGKYAKMLLVTD